MKLVLLSIVGFAGSLASATTAQQVRQVQAPPAKSGTSAPQAKSNSIHLGTSRTKPAPGLAAPVHPRPGGIFPIVGGAAETCAGATAIAGPGTFNGNNVGAVMEQTVNCAASVEVGDVWYSWTAGATGSQVMSLCSVTSSGTADFDTLLTVYATSCGGTMLACNDDGPGCDPGPGTGSVPGDWTSTVQFGVTNGNVYKIQISGFDSGTGFGNYTLHIKSVVTPPSNDNCTAPAAITGAGPHAFDNTNGTSGPQHQAEAVCSQFGVTGVNADLWYAWTAGFTGSARLSACFQGNTVDTKMGVYAPATPGTCPAGAPLACNDDSCGLQAQVDWPATSGSVYRLQVGTYPGGVAGDQGLGVFGGAGTFTVTPTPTPPANDDCAAATGPLFGPGPHNFDTSTATTGAIGQDQGICLSNPGGTPINNDQWIKWSAFSTGQATLTTCGLTTVDTKIATYPVSPCPVVGVQSALGCNDDNCPAAVQSSLCWPVTNGAQYMIQMGTFPGAIGGPGQFAVSIGASSVTVCRLDDGASENLLGWLAGGEMAWMQRFGDLGDSTHVSNIRVTWGSAAFPGGSPGNGSASKVAIWDDPDDDGDPDDAVLIQLVNTTVSNVDTDVFVTVPITPVVASGVFFLGAGLAHSGGQFVAPLDQTCPIFEAAWFFGNNNATPVDYSNVQNNVNPPASFSAAGAPGNVMVRGNCADPSGVTFCEPGLDGVIGCPCGNAPSGPGRGCENSAGSGGASLNNEGIGMLTSDTLVFKGRGLMPTGASIVMQGTTEIAGGVMFGDGVRCLGGSIQRLYTLNAAGGQITAPQPGDKSVSARSHEVGDPLLAGQTRYYMVYYRDAAPGFGCFSPGSATYNSSSSKRILWIL